MLSFESSNARKISLEGGNQDPGDPGVGKVKGGKDFFPSSRGGGGLTLDDTMSQPKRKSTNNTWVNTHIDRDKNATSINWTKMSSWKEVELNETILYI